MRVDCVQVTTRLPPMSEQNHRADTPDYVAAQEVLTELAVRDRSILTKLLHGLHRNVILCNTCGNKSLTFEPFTVLTLSFPSAGRCTLQVSALVRCVHVSHVYNKRFSWM